MAHDIDSAAAAVAAADKELAVSLLALLHGAHEPASSSHSAHPTLERLGRFAQALQRALSQHNG